MGGEVGSELFWCGMEGGVVEVGAHGAADDFGVPEVDGAGEGDGGGDAECGGGAEDGADVARVLDAVEDEEAEWAVSGEIGERPFWNLDNGEDALWGFGLGGAPEFVLIDLAKTEVAARGLLTKSVVEGRATWRGVELWSDEYAPDAKGGGEDFFDAADTFGDEKMFALAGAAAL